MTKAARLRELLAGPEPIQLPGGSTVFQVRLIEEAGFDVAYMPGGGGAGNIFGLPDTGLITQTEMIGHAERLARSIDIPLIADADDGYGAPTNVYRTIRMFERAGVAGVHLEDQEWPKRCGHLGGKQVIAKEDMINKLKAALDARQDKDFVIIARCDALAVEGFEAALERGKAYEETGADVIFIEAPSTMEQLERIAKTYSVPTWLNVSTSGKTPMVTVDQARELGFKIILYPNFAMFAGLKAAREVLGAIRSSGDVKSIVDRTISFNEYMRLAGIDPVIEQETRYGMSVSRLTTK
jgi:2-methylisocitrate lyase-like PEP mutase family enzyme